MLRTNVSLALPTSGRDTKISVHTQALLCRVLSPIHGTIVRECGAAQEKCVHSVLCPGFMDTGTTHTPTEQQWLTLRWCAGETENLSH